MLRDLRGRSLASRLDEREQVAAHSILLRRAEAVWSTVVDLEPNIVDQLGREQRCWTDRNDLVVVAVNEERGDVDLLQVLSLVGLGKSLDAVVDGVETT